MEEILKKIEELKEILGSFSAREGKNIVLTITSKSVIKEGLTIEYGRKMHVAKKSYQTSASMSIDDV